MELVPALCVGMCDLLDLFGVTLTFWLLSCVIGVPSVLGPSDLQVLSDHLKNAHPKYWDKRPAGHD
jgi:hypothetical protein